MVIVIFTLASFLIVGCQTTPTEKTIEAPPDVLESIETELEKPKIDKEKIIRQVKRSTDYNERAFRKIEELEIRLDRLERENRELKSKNQELKNELENYRKLKTAFFAIVFVIFFGFLVRFLIQNRRLFGFV